MQNDNRDIRDEAERNRAREQERGAHEDTAAAWSYRPEQSSEDQPPQYPARPQQPEPTPRPRAPENPNYRPQPREPQPPAYQPPQYQQPREQPAAYQPPQYPQPREPQRPAYERPREPERDAAAEREHRMALLARFRLGLYYLAHLFAIVIGFRFILLLLAANPTNQFADFIYSVSYPLVAPFLTLFGQGPPQYGNRVIEVSDLFAIGVYYLLAWGIVRGMYLIFAPSDESMRI